MPERATVTRARRISAIWIVPLVALLLGAWMVYYTYRNRGPEITIVFDTAEGLEAGKTSIRSRNVALGTVTTIGLGEDLESVVVVARLEREARPLLREDTQFWVVRPRVGAGGITGLGTILSGGYIELAPGQGKRGRRRFDGLDQPPVTAIGAPGLKLSLLSHEASSLRAGDDILYHGFRVGRVESAQFDLENERLAYDAFIEEPYDALVTTNTRFWNASGISFKAGADGIELDTGSLQSMLLGGVAFGLPEDLPPGARAEDGAVFTLYPDEAAIHERPFRKSVEYVVQFERSVRGLRPGAPVEYRGLRAGSVVRVMIEELAGERSESSGPSPIPVLIRVEPGRLAFPDDEAGLAALESTVERGVGAGLRASLASGNLVTGSLYVAIDIYPGEPAAPMGSFAGRATIPTVASGLGGIEQQVTALLQKLNALPLDDVVSSADDTLVELRGAVASLERVLESEGLQSLPESVETTLVELDRTLRRIADLASSLEEQPSSLLFSRDPPLDPEPPARSP